MAGFCTPPFAPASFGSLEKELDKELCESSGDDNDGIEDSKMLDWLDLEAMSLSRVLLGFLIAQLGKLCFR